MKSYKITSLDPLVLEDSVNGDMYLLGSDCLDMRFEQYMRAVVGDSFIDEMRVSIQVHAGIHITSSIVSESTITESADVGPGYGVDTSQLGPLKVSLVMNIVRRLHNALDDGYSLSNEGRYPSEH